MKRLLHGQPTAARCPPLLACRYTCVDGLVEINTFFLIARRCFPRWRKPIGWVQQCAGALLC